MTQKESQRHKGRSLKHLAPERGSTRRKVFTDGATKKIQGFMKNHLPGSSYQSLRFLKRGHLRAVTGSGLIMIIVATH